MGSFIKDDEIYELETRFRIMKSALIKKMPFIFCYLDNIFVEITKSEQIPIAAVDKNTLYMNVNLFKKGDESVLFVLAHEVLHIALMDIQRFRAIELNNPHIKHSIYLHNVACDAVNNELLFENKIVQDDVDLSPITYKYLEDDLGVTAFDNKEMIYRQLLTSDKAQKLYGNKSIDLIFNPDGGSSGNGMGNNGKSNGSSYDEIIDDVNGASVNIHTGCNSNKIASSKNIEELKKNMESALLSSYSSAKMIGNQSAGMDREVNGIIKSKVNWKVLASRKISDTFRKFHKNTYSVPNRRTYGSKYILPGTKMFSIPDVRVLLDTSGSISGKELEIFISEIYAIANTFDSHVHVYPFDAEVYKTVSLKSKNDIRKLVNSLKGGGGTVIDPALKIAVKESRQDDIFVIMTDGEIWDTDRNERVLRKIKPLVLTTRSKPWRYCDTIYVN